MPPVVVALHGDGLLLLLPQPPADRADKNNISANRQSFSMKSPLVETVNETDRHDQQSD
jgi:hypothetical protein